MIQMFPTFSDFLHALLTLALVPGFERLQRHEGEKKKKRSFRGIIFHVFLYFYLTNRIKKMRRLAWLNGCSILLYVFKVLAANYVNRGKNL